MSWIFYQPLLDEFGTDYPDIPLLLRDDSGFTKPELYNQYETKGVSYAICLKENGILRELAAGINEHLIKNTWEDMVFNAVCYGEFFYQAKLWDYPRRVVRKVENLQNADSHVYIYRNKH